jgi:hypothetical protein
LAFFEKTGNRGEIGKLAFLYSSLREFVIRKSSVLG